MKISASENTGNVIRVHYKQSHFENEAVGGGGGGGGGLLDSTIRDKQNFSLKETTWKWKSNNLQYRLQIC